MIKLISKQYIECLFFLTAAVKHLFSDSILALGNIEATSGLVYQKFLQLLGLPESGPKYSSHPPFYDIHIHFMIYTEFLMPAFNLRVRDGIHTLLSHVMLKLGC